MEFIRLYLRVLGELREERALSWSLFLANVLLAASQFAEPFLLGRVIDALVRPRPTGVKVTFDELSPLVGAWVAIGVFNLTAGVMVALHADRLSHRRRIAVIAKFYRHVLSLPLSFHIDQHSGRTMKTMLGGSQAMWSLWLNFFREHAASLVALVVLLPGALLFEWRLGLLLLAFVLGLSVGMGWLVSSTISRQRDVNEHQSVMTEHAADVFGNLVLVQSFTQAPREIANLETIAQRFLRSQLPVLNWWAAFSMATRAAATVTLTGILLLGTLLHLRGEASVGQVVSTMSLASMLIGRLEATVKFVNSLFTEAPKVQDFFAVLDDAPGVRDVAGAITATRLRGDVAFERVAFSYQRDRPVLSDVEFNVRAGETVALVGATGAGKTTTLSLLYRSYDPSGGRILLDGIDLRHYTLDSLRRQIAVVFQEPLLFARSVRDNLWVGRPDASEEELWAALERAQARAMVEALPQGLDTVLSERARSLSGGERQRLAIARALLKAPPILILDEATAPLDAATEHRLSIALAEVMRGRTTFVIAHRLVTVQKADRILVFEGGRIVEQGSFDELVRQRGYFSRLARAQRLV